MASLEELEQRVEAIERRDLLADEFHKHLERSDNTTISALNTLSDAINNPKTGLIVEFDRFRRDINKDRKILITAISTMFIIVSTALDIFAPVIRHLFGLSGQ